MTRNPLTQARLVALCLFGALLLGYPLITLASRAVLFAGVPVFFLYAFGVWGGLVALTALVVELGDRRQRPGDATRRSPTLPAGD